MAFALLPTRYHVLPAVGYRPAGVGCVILLYVVVIGVVIIVLYFRILRWQAGWQAKGKCLLVLRKENGMGNGLAGEGSMAVLEKFFSRSFIIHHKTF